MQPSIDKLSTHKLSLGKLIYQIFSYKSERVFIPWNMLPVVGAKESIACIKVSAYKESSSTWSIISIAFDILAFFFISFLFFTLCVNNSIKILKSLSLSEQAAVN